MGYTRCGIQFLAKNYSMVWYSDARGLLNFKLRFGLCCSVNWPKHDRGYSPDPGGQGSGRSPRQGPRGGEGGRGEGPPRAHPNMSTL